MASVKKTLLLVSNDHYDIAAKNSSGKEAVSQKELEKRIRNFEEEQFSVSKSTVVEDSDDDDDDDDECPRKRKKTTSSAISRLWKMDGNNVLVSYSNNTCKILNMGTKEMQEAKPKYGGDVRFWRYNGREYYFVNYKSNAKLFVFQGSQEVFQLGNHPNLTHSFGAAGLED